MCGIAGWLAHDHRSQADLSSVRLFAAAMVHRGPDGGGFWTEGPAALAHRRLAIVDLSAAGRQPMTSEDGQVAIVVNGEIYNHRELRERLEKAGHRFASQSDSEVVAHLYEEVGERVPELLEGMFAFAIWDARRHRLLLARDRFGEKPLYYARRKDGFVFASELGALLADPRTEAELDPEALDLYLSLQYVPAPRSIFRGIHKLPAGTSLSLTCGEEPFLRRYDVAAARQTSALTEGEAVGQVRDVVEKAVASRLMSDVPVGAFLSGGLDSSIVVACMARSSGRRVKTFSVGFEGTELDELPFARLVAARYGTEHQEIIVKPDIEALLPALVRHHGEPFGDSSSLPTYHLCAATRRQVTVALSGDAADEAFGGYRRYRFAALASRLRGRGWATFIGAAASVLPRSRRTSVRAFARRLVQEPAARYLGLVGHFDLSQRLALQGPALHDVTTRDRALVFLRDKLDVAATQDETNALCALDQATYLPDDIFVKVDTASMSHGLEARAPFAARGVMELASALPGHLKLRRGVGKYVLRKAFADLVPSPILARKKKGFASPVRGWFAGPLYDHAHELLLSPTARGRGYLLSSAVEDLLERNRAGEDHGERLWDLAVLEQWFREMVDGRPKHMAEVAARAASLDREG